MQRDFPSCITLNHVAQSIAEHSFAIYRLPSSTSVVIHDAWQQALRFFTLVSPRNKFDCQRIVEGHLYGYNIPSPAKELFRAFCLSPIQPWPCENEKDDDDDHQHRDNNNNTFQKASITVAEELHQLLMDTYQEIVRYQSKEMIGSAEKNDDNDGCNNSSINNNNKEVKNKEEQTSNPDHQDTKNLKNKRLRPNHPQGTAIKMIRLKQIQDTSTSLHAIHQENAYYPVDNLHILKCPLDYFYYHGRNPKADNCTEHIDRGILIVVCLTPVPGLEVEMRASTKFYCPEESIAQQQLPMQQDSSCFDYSKQSSPGSAMFEWVCIMAGGQLFHQTGIPPCVHRVRNKLPRPRLSISYELRL